MALNFVLVGETAILQPYSLIFFAFLGVLETFIQDKV